MSRLSNHILSYLRLKKIFCYKHQTAGIYCNGQQAETVRSLIGAADRMARLTSQMLAYSGRSHFVIEAVDLSPDTLSADMASQAERLH